MSTQPLHTTQIDQLPVSVYATNEALGAAAADEAAEIIRGAVTARGVANIIVATGNSQLTFLAALRALPGCRGRRSTSSTWTNMSTCRPATRPASPPSCAGTCWIMSRSRSSSPCPAWLATPRPPAASTRRCCAPTLLTSAPGHRRERPPGVQRSAVRRLR